MPRPRRPSAPLVGLSSLLLALAGCVTSVPLGSDGVTDAAPDTADGSTLDGATDAFDATDAIDASDAQDASDVNDALDAQDGSSEAACEAVPGAADVYVDARATGPSNGTATCPFHTIREATALPSPSAPRVIHVAGAASTVTYREAGPIVLGPNLELRGEGGVAELICASGCTFPDGTVILDGGGVIDGFTITTETAGPPYGVKVTAKVAAVAPIIRNVKVPLAKTYGILADASVDVGPNVVITYAASSGLYHGGPPSSVLRIQGPGNVFDGNKAHGIFDNSAKLVLSGTSASSNVGDGVHFEGYPTATNTLTGLVAKKNGGDGVRATGEYSSVQITGSTLVGNGGFGVRFRYRYVSGSQQNALSVGASTVGGATDANTRGSICLEQAPATVSFATDGWTACPPLQRTITSCDDAPPGSYQDLWIAPVAAATAPNVTACAIGP
jgi:hypothetical protein